MADTDLLTIEEACAVLRIGKSLLYELVRTNQIPHMRIGYRYRFPRWRLNEWIEQKSAMKGGANRV